MNEDNLVDSSFWNGSFIKKMFSLPVVRKDSKNDPPLVKVANLQQQCVIIEVVEQRTNSDAFYYLTCPDLVIRTIKLSESNTKIIYNI
jgi:hypothetical protein